MTKFTFTKEVKYALDTFQKAIKNFPLGSYSFGVHNVPTLEINTIRAWCLVNDYECRMTQNKTEVENEEYVSLSISSKFIFLNVFSLRYSLD